MFGRETFTSSFPFLLKWSIARRYKQFRELALQMKTKPLISALPPRQGNKTSDAVTQNRKMYFSRFVRRLIPQQHVGRVQQFLTGGMVDIRWVRADSIDGRTVAAGPMSAAAPADPQSALETIPE